MKFEERLIDVLSVMRRLLRSGIPNSFYIDNVVVERPVRVGGGSCRGFTTKIILVKHLYIIKHFHLPYLLQRNSQALNVFFD